MNPFTKQQWNQLISNGSSQNRGKDHKPIVKLFLPNTGCVWLLTELDPEDDDIAFGLCDLGMGFPELDYVSIEEITSVRSPQFGLYVIQDYFFVAKYPISVYAAAARVNCSIVEDDSLLKLYAPINPLPRPRLE